MTQDTLFVRVVSGRFFEKQDVFGKGDPYVIVRYDTTKFKTTVYHNTLEATFDEEFEFSFDRTKTFSRTILFELYDEDSTFKADNDDFVGV
jgi:Ca2+-dependent lipid-binding protein